MKFSFLAAVLSAAVFVVVSAAPSSAANCGDKLNNQTFCCPHTPNGNDYFFSTFTFSGTENSVFTLVTNASGNYTCSCQVSGSVNTPQFDQAKDFICHGDDVPSGLVGKATGTKIMKGQWIHYGATYIYTCTVGACN